MSNSVAVRRDEDSFFVALQRLKPEFGITGNHLVTFMRDSVAVRLDDDSFFKSLQRLKQVLGITGKSLVTSVSVRSDGMVTAPSSRSNG